VGKVEVFPGEGLTWGQVHEVVGTPLNPMRTTQSQSQSQRKGRRKAKEKGKRLMGLREEDEANSNETRDDAQYVEEGDDSYYDSMASSLDSTHGGNDIELSKVIRGGDEW
ncbi:hypothetical protein AMTR_s00119p00126040, partial [Amborella trichopoda]